MSGFRKIRKPPHRLVELPAPGEQCNLCLEGITHRLDLSPAQELVHSFQVSFGEICLGLHADDVDFGNVVGRPLIVKINVAAVNATLPDYKWFAVVTGYNCVQTLRPDGTADSYAGTDQRGTICLLRLDKASATPWTLGSNYYKIKTPYDTTVADTTKPNGLSPVAYLPNSNGRADAAYRYASALQAHLWKLDLAVGPPTLSGPH